METTKRNSYYLSTLAKGLRLLNLFTERQSELSLTEISRRLDIDKTSAYRFVSTLVQLGYLRRDPQTRLLKLGPEALRVGYGFLQSFDLLQTVKPFVDEFYERKNTTIDTALLDGDSFVILYRREARDTLTFRLPAVVSDLYCNALGKAVMAFLSAEEAGRIIDHQSFQARTANTLTNPEELRGDLAGIRVRGFSINNEEYVPGLISIGAPFFGGKSGKLKGSISFDFSTAEHTLKEVIRDYAGDLLQLAARISKVMPAA